jgi:UDP-N-acetylmuramoyl-tripeptide--D-alanyl-D-alanine ligase
VVVGDTLVALQDYAKSWRKDFSMPVVAITGSNGKTTTKQLTAAIVQERGAALATEGNLNNHIGVPLTLLRLRESHRTAVIEMGANHGGEIAHLAAIARPDIGVVTMAGDAHLEGFGSRDGVAKSKGELFSAVGAARGISIVNADDHYSTLWRGMAADGSILTFGFLPGADVRAERVELHETASHFVLVTPEGRADVTLPLPGRHNVANALAASAAGIALGIAPDSIAARLATIVPVSGRVSWKRGGANGVRVLDDTYNANPSSLRAALELLITVPAQRWLVLGEMKELGDRSEELHAEAGRTARQLGIDRVYTVGSLAQFAADGYGKGHHFDDMEALVDALLMDLKAPERADVAVLVKGSRSSHMERVVAALTGEPAEGGH